MARPMAASAAATVRTKSAKICPARSCRWVEKATRLMFTASSISSIDIRMMMTFLRFRKMTKITRVKRIEETVRECQRDQKSDVEGNRVDVSVDRDGRRMTHQ